jgi:hypothetical protein
MKELIGWFIVAMSLKVVIDWSLQRLAESLQARRKIMELATFPKEQGNE